MYYRISLGEKKDDIKKQWKEIANKFTTETLICFYKINKSDHNDNININNASPKLPMY